MQNVRFSTSVRGYDRDEVHRYILKVNTLLAELRITAAPEYAIKAALESVQEERGSVIAEAEQEAEEITRRSRSQADDRIEEAKREAEQLRDAAAEEAARNDRGRRDPHPRTPGRMWTECRRGAIAPLWSSWNCPGSSTSCWSETARTASRPLSRRRQHSPADRCLLRRRCLHRA